MATILQKTDLASSSFVNSNTLGAGGVKVNVGTGSDVKAAIDAAVAAGGGAASSVPASGVIAGALGAGVTTTPASVVGFNAAALAAVPDATDTIKGISALNQGTAAGDATNSTDALTATGLAAILNGTSPNTTPNALQAAVSSNPANYGTLGTALAPTAAPTAANPATRIVNTNGEVFDWNGTGWFLSGYGFAHNSGLLTNVTNISNGGGGSAVLYMFTVPRSGRVSVSGKAFYLPQNIPTANSNVGVLGGIYINGTECIVQTAVYSHDGATSRATSLNPSAHNVFVNTGDVLELRISYDAFGALSEYNSFSLQYTS